MLSAELQEMPRNRPVVLRNLTCPYCGCELDKASSTKEHVIGRRFVPVGTLYQDWNLILCACKTCNVRKSDLEDDISVITMHHDAFGNSPSSEAVAEVERKKSKSRSRRTGKSVGESIESMTLQTKFGSSASMTFTFTGPPQVQSDRVFELAHLQMMGFFYFLTYKEERSRGYFWLGKFAPVLEARKSDWGNPTHLAFMRTVLAWEPRILVSTAKGHYAAAIRKHPTQNLWSWAVEWNKSFRVVGYFGEESSAREAIAQLPLLEGRSIVEGETRWVRYRKETPLTEAEDRLFHWTAE